MKQSHFDPVPPHVVDKVIAASPHKPQAGGAKWLVLCALSDCSVDGGRQSTEAPQGQREGSGARGLDNLVDAFWVDASFRAGCCAATDSAGSDSDLVEPPAPESAAA